MKKKMKKDMPENSSPKPFCNQSFNNFLNIEESFYLSISLNHQAYLYLFKFI